MVCVVVHAPLSCRKGQGKVTPKINFPLKHFFNYGSDRSSSSAVEHRERAMSLPTKVKYCLLPRLRPGCRWFESNLLREFFRSKKSYFDPSGHRQHFSDYLNKSYGSHGVNGALRLGSGRIGSIPMRFPNLGQGRLTSNLF